MDTYEKKYKEALERARDFKNNIVHKELTVGESIMDYIFPELRESEDERIRKAIIAYIKDDIEELSYEAEIEELKKYLAWLEKQGEQTWSEEDEEMCESVIDVLVNNTMSDSEGDKVYSEEIDWLKSFRPQNRWRPSDEQIEILNMVLTNESMDDNIARILRELREQLKKLKER